MVLMKILVIALQKLVSRVVLSYKRIHNNRNFFYGEMVLIFFINTIVKPHVKRLGLARFFSFFSDLISGCRTEPEPEP